MKKLLMLMSVLLLSFAVNANEKASRQSVEKLLELTQASQSIDAMYNQVGKMFDGMAKQLKISPDERPQFNEYMQKVFAIMKKDMNWTAIKEPTIDVYIKHFSQKEVDGLIAFYQSDIGRTMTKKMPLVMQDSMMISQQLMVKVLPKIQALAKELQQQVRAERQQNKAKGQ